MEEQGIVFSRPMSETRHEGSANSVKSRFSNISDLRSVSAKSRSSGGFDVLENKIVEVQPAEPVDISYS